MKIVKDKKVIYESGGDAPIGSILRHCRHGKKSYIVVEARDSDGRRCLYCDLLGKDCHFVDCADYHRKDKKNVVLKLYSVGRLSREKIVYNDER